jgi:hypothetical protein
VVCEGVAAEQASAVTAARSTTTKTRTWDRVSLMPEE